MQIFLVNPSLPHVLILSPVRSPEMCADFQRNVQYFSAFFANNSPAFSHQFLLGEGFAIVQIFGFQFSARIFVLRTPHSETLVISKVCLCFVSTFWIIQNQKHHEIRSKVFQQYQTTGRANSLFFQLFEVFPETAPMIFLYH